MAYVNVAEWKPDQVTDWLKGLDSAISPYVQYFTLNGISGQQLLNLGPDDLDHLGIVKIGLQEIILEGVEHLRNIHYELDRENLQLLAMRLSCLAHSLHNELAHCHDSRSQRLSTQVLADIANIVSAVKPLIAWLDRPGFAGECEWAGVRREVLGVALAMATSGQRDRFAEAPAAEMLQASRALASLADRLVREPTDPLLLQPASLDLATLRKRSSDDLGFYIVPSTRRLHQISELKLNSAAHQSGKIEPGDEIIQINYQTVVGWDVKHVMGLFAECPTEVLLTVKKRPRHTKVYGQIYVKPYRLPSKKRAPHPFSARPLLLHDHLLSINLRQPIPLNRLSEVVNKKVEESSGGVGVGVGSGPGRPGVDGSASGEEEEEEGPPQLSHELAPPSNPLHRRATITGASPLSKRPPLNIHHLWHDLKLEKENVNKKSTTSVIDFEERLNSSSFVKEEPPPEMEEKEIPREEEERPVECLSIRERIELFSAKEEANSKSRSSQIRPTVINVIEPEATSLVTNIVVEETPPAASGKTTADSRPQSEVSEPSVEVEAVTEVREISSNTTDTSVVTSEPGSIDLPSSGYSSCATTLTSNSGLDRPFDPRMLSERTGSSLNFYHEQVPFKGYNSLERQNRPMDYGGGWSSVRAGSMDSVEHGRVVETINDLLGLGEDEPLESLGGSLPAAARQRHGFAAPPRDEFTSELSRTISQVCGVEEYGAVPVWHCSGGSVSSLASGGGTSGESGGPRDQAPPLPPPRPSLSKPPSACYRAIIAARSIGKASPKAQRKKNPILARGRNISPNEFSSKETEGWLQQRCRRGSSTWLRRWCLISAHTLYTYVNKQSSRAETMVCLPGFTASPAEEVKSRPFAFKVYHDGTSFYFAAESYLELSSWLDAITISTLAQGHQSREIAWSESEGEEESVGRRAAPTPAPRLQQATPLPAHPVPPPAHPAPHHSSIASLASDLPKKFGSLKKLACRGGSGSSEKEKSASSLDRKCRRLLGTAAPQPIPTPQFRSYRRVHNTVAPPPPLHPPSRGDGEGERREGPPRPADMADYRRTSLHAPPSGRSRGGGVEERSGPGGGRLHAQSVQPWQSSSIHPPTPLHTQSEIEGGIQIHQLNDSPSPDLPDLLQRIIEGRKARPKKQPSPHPPPPVTSPSLPLHSGSWVGERPRRTGPPPPAPFSTFPSGRVEYCSGCGGGSLRMQGPSHHGPHGSMHHVSAHHGSTHHPHHASHHRHHHHHHHCHTLPL